MTDGVTHWTAAQMEEAALELDVMVRMSPLLGSQRVLFSDYAAMLRHGAEALRTVEAQRVQTCETCRFAGEPHLNPEDDYCRENCYVPLRPDERRPHRWCSGMLTHVPLTVHGQPFGCRGWAQRPAPPDGPAPETP